MTTTYKKRNSLVKIKINGTWVSEEKEIKDGEVQAFLSLLFENSGDPTVIGCLLRL